MSDNQWRTLAAIAVPLIVVALMLIIAAAYDQDDSDSSGEPVMAVIEAHDAWIRATAPSARPESAASRLTGAFMTLTNTGRAADRLVSASVEADIASAVEIHETTVNADDVMQMRPVSGIDIPAGEQVDLMPGGYHLMLILVQRDLTPGEMIAITLQFESGETLAVEAEVRDLAATGDMSGSESAE